MKKETHELLYGGVTAPAGFSAVGVHAGLKPGHQPDMALLFSRVPANAAGTFTTNKVQAASVRLCREHLIAEGRAQAVVINSGNANACTGAQGERDAVTMAEQTATRLNIPTTLVQVCSTGTIGRLLPMEIITAGITKAANQLSDTGGAAAARAIMTTDTKPKEFAIRFKLEGRDITIGGMAKGAGMIAPNMATMLAFITTDACVESTALQTALRAAVNKSFNCITIDGDQSTNDTALCLANGIAANSLLQPKHRDWRKFTNALNEVCLQLALMIVRDGEGATKMVTVKVRQAPSRRVAGKVARSVAQSLLVKTSWFGADPNWGRVICATGYAGVPLNPDIIDIFYDDQCAVRNGQSAGLQEDVLHKIIARPEFTVTIDLNLGKHSATIYTCDCSDRYVAINASYMT